MIHSGGRRWACMAVGAATIGLSGSAAADASPTPSAEDPQESSAGGEASPPKRSHGRRRGVDYTDYNNVIFFNFGSTASGRLEIEYERALHSRVSIFAAWYVLFFDSLGNENLVGSGFLIGARAFLLGDAPEGIWVAAQVGGYNRRSRDLPDVRQWGVQTGGMVGWTGVWYRVAFTLGGGFTYSYGRVTVLEQSVSLAEWSPWFKIGVGVAF